MSETIAPTSYTEVITALLDDAGLTTPESTQPDLLASDAPQEQAPIDATPPAKATRASKKKDVSGRALIDIPAHDLKCGEYATLPADVAIALQAAGEFDPNAVQPE